MFDKYTGYELYVFIIFINFYCVVSWHFFVCVMMKKSAELYYFNIQRISNGQNLNFVSVVNHSANMFVRFELLGVDTLSFYDSYRWFTKSPKCLKNQLLHSWMKWPTSLKINRLRINEQLDNKRINAACLSREIFGMGKSDVGWKLF